MILFDHRIPLFSVGDSCNKNSNWSRFLHCCFSQIIGCFLFYTCQVEAFVRLLIHSFSSFKSVEVLWPENDCSPTVPVRVAKMFPFSRMSLQPLNVSNNNQRLDNLINVSPTNYLSLSQRPATESIPSASTRDIIQASNFGHTFEQLFLRFCMRFSLKIPLKSRAVLSKVKFY